MKNEFEISVFKLGVFIAAIFVLGLALAYKHLNGFPALNAMLGVVTIVSFFGILALPGGRESESGGFTVGRVRFAITSALVLLFVVYYSTVIFWNVGPESEKLDGVAGELLDQLSDLLMIVIPFYFGATAAENVMKSRSNTDD